MSDTDSQAIAIRCLSLVLGGAARVDYAVESGGEDRITTAIIELSFTAADREHHDAANGDLGARFEKAEAMAGYWMQRAQALQAEIRKRSA